MTTPKRNAWANLSGVWCAMRDKQEREAKGVTCGDCRHFDPDGPVRCTVRLPMWAGFIESSRQVECNRSAVTCSCFSPGRKSKRKP